MRNVIKTSSYLVANSGVPKLPMEVLSIQKEVNAKYPNTANISGLISKNPDLLSMFIKACKSSYPKEEANIVCAKTAVDILGLEEVESLVIASAIMTNLDLKYIEADFVAKCIKRGIAASEYSHWVYGVDRGTAYMIGLLADMGGLILNKKDPSFLKTIYPKNMARPFSSSEFMYDSFGASLSEVSSVLAKYWGVSELIVKAIFLQDKTLSAASTEDAKRLVSMVSLINLSKVSLCELEESSYMTAELKKLRKQSIKNLKGVNSQSHKAAASAIKLYGSNISAKELMKS